MLRRARTLVPVLLAQALAPCPRPAGATPPQPPLDLRVVLLETPAPGKPVAYAIDVTPLLPAERLRVRVVPPRDVALAVPGDTLRFASDLAPGHARRFTGTLRVPPGRRRYVYVRAEIETASGRTWSRGEHLVVLAGAPLEPDPVARSRADGRGGALVEYDGQSGAARR